MSLSIVKQVEIGGSFRETTDDDEYVDEADDEETGDENINVGKPPPHPNRKPSSVWKHFTKDINPKVNKCVYNYRGQQFACDSRFNGTSHLNYHVAKSCRSIPHDSDKKLKTLAFGKNSDSEDSCTLTTWSFN